VREREDANRTREAGDSVLVKTEGSQSEERGSQGASDAALRRPYIKGNTPQLGGRRIDCIGRLAWRPSESGDRESTFCAN